MLLANQESVMASCAHGGHEGQGLGGGQRLAGPGWQGRVGGEVVLGKGFSNCLILAFSKQARSGLVGCQG